MSEDWEKLFELKQTDWLEVCKENDRLVSYLAKAREGLLRGLACAEALNKFGAFVGSNQQQQNVDFIKEALSNLKSDE